MARLLPLIALVGLLAEPSCAAVPESSCSCPGLKAEALSRALSRQFAGWTVVRTQDLAEDDQAIWRREYPGQCPGVRQVRFDGDSRATCVVLLVHSEGRRLFEQVVAIPTAGASPVAVVLKPSEVAGLSVLEAAEPGIYMHPEDPSESVEIHTGAVLLTAIEKGAILIYRVGDGYRLLIVSE